MIHLSDFSRTLSLLVLFLIINPSSSSAVVNQTPQEKQKQTLLPLAQNFEINRYTSLGCKADVKGGNPNRKGEVLQLPNVRISDIHGPYGYPSFPSKSSNIPIGIFHREIKAEEFIEKPHTFEDCSFLCQKDFNCSSFSFFHGGAANVAVLGGGGNEEQFSADNERVVQANGGITDNNIPTTNNNNNDLPHSPSKPPIHSDGYQGEDPKRSNWWCKLYGHEVEKDSFMQPNSKNRNIPKATSSSLVTSGIILDRVGLCWKKNVEDHDGVNTAEYHTPEYHTPAAGIPSPVPQILFTAPFIPPRAHTPSPPIISSLVTLSPPTVEIANKIKMEKRVQDQLINFNSTLNNYTPMGRGYTFAISVWIWALSTSDNKEFADAPETSSTANNNNKKPPQVIFTSTRLEG